MEILMIEGIIRPVVQTANYCGASAYSPSPELEIWESSYEVPDCLVDSISENLDDDANFWKNRTVSCMLAAPHVVSISFIPTDGSECEILFLQKKDLSEKKTGFVASYLNEEDQRELGATSELFSLYDKISRVEDIDNSLRGITHPINESEIRPILCSFLADPKTHCLTLTFHNDKQEVFTVGWIKA